MCWPECQADCFWGLSTSTTQQAQANRTTCAEKQEEMMLARGMEEDVEGRCSKFGFVKQQNII